MQTSEKPMEPAMLKPEKPMEMASANPEMTKEGQAEKPLAEKMQMAKAEGAVETVKPEVPTLVAQPTAGGRFVSGQAIIRRGDNLWTIARRVYGEGIRYTTIYEANQSQIRNPNLIYPGQVFDLPADANQ